MDVNSEFLNKGYTELLRKNTETKENTAYVSGKNPKIILEKDKPKPDNRIPVPMAKWAVNTVVGYAGRPGDITTEYVRIDQDDEEEGLDEYQETIKGFQEHNNEDLQNSELLNLGLSYGWAFEIWWIKDQAEEGEAPDPLPEYKWCPPNEAFPVFTETLKPELEAFIRYWKDRDDAIVADVYHPFLWERYKKDKDTEDFIFIDSMETPYSIPANVYTVNMEKMPIFQAEKPIINSYDSAISKTQNDVDRFSDAIMMMPGLLDAAQKANLRSEEQAIFDGLDEFERWPEYLQKNLTGVSEFYKNHTINLERLFHKSVGIPDISDENFAGNQSGVAIAFKLLPLEFLVSVIEAYFKQGLERRKVFYDDFLEMFGPSADFDEYKPLVTWKRNLPVDEATKVQVAAILSSIVSDETLLRFLPNSIVPDVEDELARIEGDIDVGEDELGALPGGNVEEAVEVATLSGIQIESAGNIIRQVAEGVLSRDAGIQQLIVFLGLTREQAEAVMGPQSGNTANTGSQSN